MSNTGLYKHVWMPTFQQRDRYLVRKKALFMSITDVYKCVCVHACVLHACMLQSPAVVVEGEPVDPLQLVVPQCVAVVEGWWVVQFGPLTGLGRLLVLEHTSLRRHFTVSLAGSIHIRHLIFKTFHGYLKNKFKTILMTFLLLIAGN